MPADLADDSPPHDDRDDDFDPAAVAEDLRLAVAHLRDQATGMMNQSAAAHGVRPGEKRDSTN